MKTFYPIECVVYIDVYIKSVTVACMTSKTWHEKA